MRGTSPQQGIMSTRQEVINDQKKRAGQTPFCWHYRSSLASACLTRDVRVGEGLGFSKVLQKRHVTAKQWQYTSNFYCVGNFGNKLYEVQNMRNLNLVKFSRATLQLTNCKVTKLTNLKVIGTSQTIFN